MSATEPVKAATSKSSPAPLKRMASPEPSATPGKATAPSAAPARALKALKEIDKRYQEASSIAMDVDKTLSLGLLGKEKKSKGRLLLSKGRMRMEIDSPDKSIVVVDGKTLWIADYPSAEFKDASVQVLKGPLDSKKGAQRSFVSLLTRGGILKHFKIVGAQKDDEGRDVYFLVPNAQSFEFKRAQLTASGDGRSIAELRYWDERDNETRLRFSNVKFDVRAPAKSFEFVPPENADVTAI